MTLVNQPNMPGYTHNFFGACLPDQLTAGSSFSGITPLVPFIGIILSNCNDLSLILIYSEFLNQRCHSHINILFLLWGCVFKTKLPICFLFFVFFLPRGWVLEGLLNSKCYFYLQLVGMWRGFVFQPWEF